MNLSDVSQVTYGADDAIPPPRELVTGSPIHWADGSTEQLRVFLANRFFDTKLEYEGREFKEPPAVQTWAAEKVLIPTLRIWRN